MAKQLSWLIILIILLSFNFLLAKEVKAGDADNVSGWAWSENIGWISFNCYNDYNGDGVKEDHCSSPTYFDYGVHICTSDADPRCTAVATPKTGKFVGYAWSKNIGWISFNETELSGCPTAPCQAKLDFLTKKVSGWAKVLSNNSWIKLKNADYGVSWNNTSQELEGWAWSDTDVGWISFNCLNQGVCATSNYKVKAQLDDAAPTVSVIAGPASVTTTWQNTDATATTSCTDNPGGSGCDSATYKLKIYTSAGDGSCPPTYFEYTLGSPYTVSSHLWVCAAAKDNAGNSGFSPARIEFKVDRISPLSAITKIRFTSTCAFLDTHPKCTLITGTCPGASPITIECPVGEVENVWLNADFTAKATDSDDGGSGLVTGTPPSCTGGCCAYSVTDLGILGTATSNGTFTTLIDANRKEPNDYWNGWILYAKAQTRQITDFDLASHTITVSPGLPNSTMTDDLYKLYRNSETTTGTLNRQCGVGISFSASVGSAAGKICSTERESTCWVSSKSFDVAGNNSGWNSRDFNIDYTAPTIGIPSLTTSPAEQGKDETFEASLQDLGGKVKQCWFYEDGVGVAATITIEEIVGDGIGDDALPCENGEICKVTAVYAPPNSGSYKYRFSCKDYGDNVGWGGELTVTVEINYPPEITAGPNYTTSPCTQPTTQAGCDVNFTATIKDDNDDDLTYTWDFGDGQSTTPATVTPPYPVDVTASHHFDTAATYTITLTIDDGRGGIDNTPTVNVPVANPTLSVDLTANPNSGVSPLNDVDLTAAVSGTMFGTINYKFDCTNDGIWELETPAQTTETYTATDLCDYPTPDTYTAKTFIERGTGIAQDTATIIVSANQPPTAINLLVTEGNYCFTLSPPIILSWDFSDPNPGDTQSAYQVQVDNNSDFSSPERDSGKVSSNSESYAPIGLSFNTTYYWQVKVWDSYDVPSAWATGPSFTTPLHPYPEPNFVWDLPSPTAEALVQFTDRTTFYNSTGTWLWDFGDGATSTVQNPTHAYSTTGTYTVTLQVTDGSGYGPCSISRKITIALPLPEWIEIPPF